jgi:hypothetical protein
LVFGSVSVAGLLARQGRTKTKFTNLLVQPKGMRPDNRAKYSLATDHLGRPHTARARAASALLVPRLLGTATDLTDRLGFVVAGTSLGKLPIDHTRHDIGTHISAEHGIVEIDRARALIFQCDDIALHRAQSLFSS